MRRNVAILVIVACLLVSGLVVTLLAARPAVGEGLWLLPSFTPEQAVRRAVRCPPPLQVVPGSFQVEGRREVAPGSVVVFYRAVCGDAGAAPLFTEGDHAVRRTWWGWQTTGGSAADSPLPPPPPGGAPSYLLQSISRHTVDAGPTALAQVHGRIDAPDGTTVELSLGDGSVLADQTHDGFFVFTVPEALALCRLRALDAAGHVQRETELGIGGELRPGAPSPWGP